MAATVTFHPIFGRPTTAARVDDEPILAGKRVHEFRVTTSSDILRIGDVVLRTEPVLPNSARSEDEPPSPSFVDVFPALGADSWITTPGLFNTTSMIYSAG